MKRATQLLDFLKRLSENNNREWFADNRAEFDGLKNEFGTTIDYLIKRLTEIDPLLSGLASKDAVYRIYRDTRFHDKTPYKTHFAAYMAKGGRKCTLGGYYLHLQPGESFMAAGIYMPESKILNRIRHQILYNSDELFPVIDNVEFKQIYPQFHGDSLKRMPLQYSKTEFERPELLKMKHHIVECPLVDSFFEADDWIEQLMKLFGIASPYVRLINDFIER